MDCQDWANRHLNRLGYNGDEESDRTKYFLRASMGIAGPLERAAFRSVYGIKQLESKEVAQ